MARALQYRPKRVLRDRLVQLNGSSKGYLIFAASELEIAGGKKVAPAFIGMVFSDPASRMFRSTPPWMVVGLTRIAEDDLSITRDDAYTLATKWFDEVHPEKEAPSV